MALLVYASRTPLPLPGCNKMEYKRVQLAECYQPLTCYVVTPAKNVSHADVFYRM